jgi:hypothetical protein
VGGVDGWTPAVVSSLFCCIHACTLRSFVAFPALQTALQTPLAGFGIVVRPALATFFLFCLFRPACFYSRCIHTRFLSHNSLALYLFCFV